MIQPGQILILKNPTMEPTYNLQSIPGGRAGTRTTLKLMSDLTKKYKASKAARELALAITRNLPGKNWAQEVAAVQNFVRNHIRYTKDIRGVETLQTPVQTLRLKAGDCDDHSTLVASLLEALGHPTRFVAVGFEPGRFHHVFTETKIGSKWVAVETTEPYKLGQRPPGIRNIMTHHN